MPSTSAILQHLSWNDLRYLLALKRHRSLSATARALGVNDTTVARRLAALTRVAGRELAWRSPQGGWQLTPLGEVVASEVEAMEQRVDRIHEHLGAAAGMHGGRVRLTSVPVIVNRLLVPRTPALLATHPGLVLELIPDSRDLSLTRREADVALRLARPVAGGGRVKARRIGRLRFSVYASAGQDPGADGDLPWIGYDESLAHLPQARWLERCLDSGDGAASPLRVHDVETALEAVVAGLGRTLLPDAIAATDPRIRRSPASPPAPMPARELWLLTHADQTDLRRIRAVCEWIVTVFAVPA